MNINKGTNSQLSTTESKKQNKNPNNQNRNRITGMEIIWGIISQRGEGENGRKGTGIKKHNWYVQNKQGDVKNSTGNEEAKELTCMAHGHELRWGLLVGRWVPGRVGKGEKFGPL